MKIDEIISDYEIFLDKIFLNLTHAGFVLDDLVELDLIAYRTESDERYLEIKEIIENNFSAGLSEVMFSGRLISVFKLKEILLYKSFKISCLELLAPREGNKFKEGLEHAEFVVRGSLVDFYEKYKNSVKFNLSAFGREVNAELIVEFGDCAVKFHEQSLLKVRRLE